MPKNKVSDPITDQETAFARLVLSGAMTDRHAAEAVGLNASEGQLYSCPVSHPIPVTNQPIPVIPPRRDFLCVPHCA